MMELENQWAKILALNGFKRVTICRIRLLLVHELLRRMNEDTYLKKKTVSAIASSFYFPSSEEA